jgi:hypothetical protein
MTTEPNPTDTPEPEAALSPAPAVVTPPPPAQPTQRFYGSPAARIALLVAGVAMIFAGGFATGHWVFDRHDNDRHRPDFSARAQRFMQGLNGQQRSGGQPRNAPGMGQMGQMPNLQQILPFLEQLLNNRNGGSNGGSRAVPNSGGSDDIQRQLQQLQRQVQQLQDQLKNAPTPTTR